MINDFKEGVLREWKKKKKKENWLWSGVGFRGGKFFKSKKK